MIKDVILQYLINRRDGGSPNYELELAWMIKDYNNDIVKKNKKK
ncbi:hypothetical protein LCGC14_1367640 [marine sediment metagenome]|uniref:Uncharacterized protein n=1 Tax=marine sediment metagenome TaxID=412755 RepID=A0A0F9N891_9ZZZZ